MAKEDRAMRRLVEEKLFQYRRWKNMLKQREQPVLSRRPYAPKAAPPAGREEAELLKRWVNAIDRARRYLKMGNPALERFMTRYFALITPLNRACSKQARHLRLMEESHISATTLYTWRREAVTCVLFFAAEAGLICLDETEASPNDEQE